jgi:hypothetical protein
MAKPGKIFVAPVDPEERSAGGWQELGYVSDNGVTYESVWEVGPVRKFKALDLTKLSEMCRAITVTFQSAERAFRILTGWKPQRSERVRQTRVLYRRKRGRRRFR